MKDFVEPLSLIETKKKNCILDTLFPVTCLSIEQTNVDVHWRCSCKTQFLLQLKRSLPFAENVGEVTELIMRK